MKSHFAIDNLIKSHFAIDKLIKSHCAINKLIKSHCAINKLIKSYFATDFSVVRLELFLSFWTCSSCKPYRNFRAILFFAEVFVFRTVPSEIDFLIAFVEELFFSHEGCAGQSNGGVNTVKKNTEIILNLLFISLCTSLQYKKVQYFSNIPKATLFHCLISRLSKI